MAYFGWSVAVSGDVVLVGALLEGSDRGAAYVYSRNQGGPDSWGEVKKLSASDGEDGDRLRCDDPWHQALVERAGMHDGDRKRYAEQRAEGETQ